MAVVTVAYMDYRASLSSFGKLDGIVQVTPPINLDPLKKYYIRPMSATLSSRIPNVYNIGNWNNRIVRVKANVADPWTTITLDIGNYTVQQISQAITKACGAYFINYLDPSLIITANSVIDKITVTVVPGKLLNGTQFCIDFSTNTNLCTTLGFSPARAIITTNGAWSSDLEPKVDTQGTICDIVCDLTNFRSLNGKVSKILFSIPLILAGNSLTEFLYPPVGSTELPLVAYTGPRTINNFTLTFRTVTDQPLYWMNGKCYVNFAICEIK